MKWYGVLVLLVIANVLLAQAVWEEPLTIRDNENLIWNKWSSLTTGENEIVHVWSEIQDGSRRILIMKFDNQGNPLWSEHPFLVAESNYKQTDSRIIASNDGCFIVTWLNNDEQYSLMAQKIDNSGNRLWSETGVFVTDQFEYGFKDRIQIFPNDNGGALISWFNYSMMIKNLDSNGINQWGGIDGSLNLASISYNNQIISDGHGGLITVDSVDDYNSILVSRFDTTGEILWDLNISLNYVQANKKNLKIVYNNIDSYYLISDNFSGFIDNLDVRKISLSGVVDSHIANVPLIDSSHSLYSIDFTTNESGNLFIVSKCYTSSYNNPYEFTWVASNLNQNLTQIWTESGIYSDTMSNIVKDNIDIVATNSDELYFTIMQSSYTVSDDFDYYSKLIKIDSDGEIQTDSSGLLINQFNFLEPDTYLAYNNELIITSSTIQNGYSNLVQKVFDDNLQSTIAEENEIINHSTTGGVSNMFYTFHLPDSERSVIIWKDYTHYMNNKIKYQIINTDGSYEFAEGGLNIAEFTNLSISEEDYDIRNISAVQNDLGQICIVWNANNYAVVMSRIIDSDGSLLGNELGEEINFSEEELNYLFVSTYNNEFYVTWMTENSNTNEKNIKGVKCNNSLQWGQQYLIYNNEDSISISYPIPNTINNYCIIKESNQAFKVINLTGQTDFTEENLVLNGWDQKFAVDNNNNLFYIWNTNHQIFLQGLSSDGNQFWDDSIIVIDNSTEQNEEYLLEPEIMINDNIHIIWGESNVSEIELKAQKISFSGELLWDADGILVDSQLETGGFYNNLIKDAGDGNIIVGFHSDNYLGINNSYSLINSDGELKFSSDCSELVGESPKIKELDFVKLTDQKVLSVWTQYHNGASGFYAQLLDFTSVDIENNDTTPLTLGLLQNYPNPFNPETNISFQVPKTGKVNLDIYNIKGQKVKTLVNDTFNAGKHTVVWNGRDANNKKVASGVYLYKLKNGKYSSTKKMILMK